MSKEQERNKFLQAADKVFSQQKGVLRRLTDVDAPFPSDMMPCIESFFRDIHPNLNPGQNTYPEVFYSQRFYPLQRMRETARMINIARSISPKTVYEIGADKGGGLYHWCQCLPSVQRVAACEVRGTPYAEEFRRAFPHLDFLFLPASSYAPGTVAVVGDWLRRTGGLHQATGGIDVLFIDGDKNNFRADFDAYLPLMTANGVVFLHDVVEPPILPYWRELQERYVTEHVIDTSEALAAMERERNGQEVDSPYEGWLRHWRGRSCTVGTVYLGRKK